MTIAAQIVALVAGLAWIATRPISSRKFRGYR